MTLVNKVRTAFPMHVCWQNASYIIYLPTHNPCSGNVCTWVKQRLPQYVHASHNYTCTCIQIFIYFSKPLRLLYFTQIFIYFSKPLRLLYSLIIYEIVIFSFFTLYSLLLLSFFLYLKSVPIYVIVHVHVHVLITTKKCIRTS